MIEGSLTKTQNKGKDQPVFQKSGQGRLRKLPRQYSLSHSSNGVSDDAVRYNFTGSHLRREWSQGDR